MVTIKKIAETSGYSSGIISRLFNDDQSLVITKAARRKIIQTALELGYERQKIKTAIDTVLILSALPEDQLVQDSYYRELENYLVKYAKAAKFKLVFADEVKDIKKDPEISGFISFGNCDQAELADLKALKGVRIDSNPFPRYFDTVKADTDDAVRETLEYFFKAGFTSISYIGGNYFDQLAGRFVLDSREKVFRETLSAHGKLQEELLFIAEALSVEQGYQQGLRLARKKPLPQACLIANDVMAIGVLQALNENGIKVPEKIALVSINDNEIARYLSPPLTTYRIDSEEIAKTAITLLEEQLVTERTVRKTVTISCPLIVRKSFVP